MNQQTFINVSTTIFVLVAIVHFLRVILGWQVTIAEWSVPAWFSWVGFIVASYIAYSGYTISKHD